MINVHAKRALIRRYTDFELITSSEQENRRTGVVSRVEANPIAIRGCFQQVNRFDNFLSEDIQLLPEGERKEVSGVLWTEHPISVGKVGSIVAEEGMTADRIRDCRTKILYKVLVVRDKFYGDFYRALIAGVAE